jgi:hypothetical protein
VEWYSDGPGLLNATRFAATTVTEGDAVYGLLRQAAEMLKDGVDDPYDDTRAYSREWKVLLPPAATWLIIAGEVIYKSCIRGEDERSARKFEDGYLRKDRWENWRAQLRVLAIREDLDDECRGFAAHAVERMAQIEERHSA